MLDTNLPYISKLGVWPLLYVMPQKIVLLVHRCLAQRCSTLLHNHFVPVNGQISSLSDRAFVNVQRPQGYNKMGIIRHWNIVKRDCKECLFQEMVEKVLLASLILPYRSSAVPRRDPGSFTDLQLSSSLAALKYSVLLILSWRFSFRNTASQSSTVDFTDWWFESWRVVSSAYLVNGAAPSRAVIASHCAVSFNALPAALRMEENPHQFSAILKCVAIYTNLVKLSYNYKFSVV